MHLATSAQSFCVFLIGGIPQSIVYLPPLINLLVTNLFYIHAQHRMIEVARRDKNGVLQCTMVSWLARSLSDVTSASRGSPNQPIRDNQKHCSAFLNVASQSENCKPTKCWQCVFRLATDVRNVSMKLQEAFWRHCKVILRTGFTVNGW